MTDRSTPENNTIKAILNYQAELEEQNAELICAKRQVESLFERYRRLYNFAPLAYFSFNPDGFILESNLAAAELLQSNCGDFQEGRTQFFSFVAPASIDLFRKHLKQVFNDDNVHSCEVEILLKAKNALYLHILSKQMRDDAGTPICYSAIIDLTEIKTAEKNAKQLETRNKELKSYAEIIAHDFRTPMLNLKGFSHELGHSFTELKQIIRDSKSYFPETIQQKVDHVLEKDISDALRFIHSSIDRMDRMVSALLKLSRLGRREMNCLEINMHDLVKTIVQSFSHQIECKGIKIDIAPLPVIVSDYLALEQIVSNLLDNAIKYLDPGHTGAINILSRENDEAVTFIICDNGRGIAAGDHEKIFEIFRRAGIQDVPGDGMGLAYVNTLVRQLGGKIWCESQLGIGTKMIFTIPKKPKS